MEYFVFLSVGQLSSSFTFRRGTVCNDSDIQVIQIGREDAFTSHVSEKGHAGNKAFVEALVHVPENRHADNKAFVEALVSHVPENRHAGNKAFVETLVRHVLEFDLSLSRPLF